MKLIQKFLNFLLPPHCPICHKPILDNHAVCGECFGKLFFLGSTVCQRCGKPLPYKEVRICGACLKKSPVYQQARSVLKYNEFSKALILPFKHADSIELTPLLVQWMDQKGKELIENCDCLIPVPLHLKRLLKRKYNQSALLAQKLAKIHHKDYEPSVLMRRRHTESQGHMTAKQRQENVKNAFKIQNSDKIKGKKILLIDDVMTTGATVSECSKVLIKAGAESVDVLTLARAFRD